MARFRKSLGGLIYLSEKLDNQHDHLRKDFEISRVYQVGPTWYVKDFYPNTVEFSREVLESGMYPQMQRAYEKLVAILSTDESFFALVILRRLRQYSVNIHWDLTDQRFVLIDAF